MRPLLGITLKLISVLMFIIMTSLIKASANAVPAGEAVFFRSFFAIPVILGWLMTRKDWRTGLKVVSPMGHFWRGFLGTAGMAATFTALALLPLPEVTALGYTAPLLTVIFAAMFLNEKVGLFRIGVVGLGLVGVMIILSPHLTAFSGSTVATSAAIGALIVLIGSIFSALAQIYIRKLVITEHTAAIVFYFSVTSTLLSLLTIPFGWKLPDWETTSFLILAGLMGGMGQIFLTSAYRFADVSMVAPFSYTSMIFALWIGYVFFDEVPTRSMLLGAALIITAGIVIILREHYLGLKRGRARAIKTPQG